MEKNTLLAVVLSVIVITIGFTVQNILYPPEPVSLAETTDAGTAERIDSRDAESPSRPEGESGQEQLPREGVTPSERPVPGNPVREVPREGISGDPVTYQNETMRVVFDPAGARIISLQLLSYTDGEGPVEMIKRGGTDRGALEFHFGNETAPPVRTLFEKVPSDDQHTLVFRRDFYIEGTPGQPFEVKRTFRFYPGEYVIETAVEITNSVNQVIPLDYAGSSYTISFGPQIGPSYAELDGRNEYRKFFYYDGGRRRELRLRTEDRSQKEERLHWASIAGKYFAVIAVPGSANYTWTFSNETPRGLDDGAAMYLSRPLFRSSANRDVQRFYVGPKVTSILNRYDRSDSNALGLQNMNFGRIEDRRLLFGWLENILKFAMQVIYRFVPNYGAAIIILTIIVKILLFPLTHKSFESTSKMQLLNPKIQELREKHKDNPQKMNQAMGELYKKEGVNPLGGCLPMLVQFPFFIAMFGVFNNHFDLRGATFIAGWITDLSAPESIWNFGDFVLPLLGWNDLRLLPILFVASQLLSSKLMQNPAAGTSNSQMKMMQYGLPLMFFFILYNMPSGLLVYWIFSNVLTVGQQAYITRKRKHQATE
ncbi:hypothetical protein AU468_01400 [Alkalispirochaeta sphaeroplastigenens]|uniref:Membrane protein insertase YidC n=1 Tax=Alkalispirochaeta sphaeroplastigenens TaxID=1187066 RepID=A0A2S4K0R9_9SPIO|nr:membrane protein insertase YidC [Alkalispirochaeta sphaeroplastigenens]POR05363.1 hypothetical protein AU468_01400 [Alkalispirochaeta sphaeroplastigenens]